MMLRVRALHLRVRRTLQQASRGMTLLEIMIVLAILALVMGLVVGPAVMDHYREARRKIARMAVRKIVDEEYPAWTLAHPGQQCPERLEDLSPSATSKDTEDPWGGRYRIYCGTNLPRGVRGFAASSPGEDSKDGTEDDIKSWE